VEYTPAELPVRQQVLVKLTQLLCHTCPAAWTW
jgi:hypothetical protein